MTRRHKCALCVCFLDVIKRISEPFQKTFRPNGKKAQISFLLSATARKSKGVKTKEYIEQVNIESWKRLVEACQEYLKKGSLIYLEGRLKTYKYEA